LALQHHLGEQEVRGRTADVDADSFQLDVFLAPDGARDLGAVGFGELAMLVQEIGVVHSVSRVLWREARWVARSTLGGAKRAGWRETRWVARNAQTSGRNPYHCASTGLRRVALAKRPAGHTLSATRRKNNGTAASFRLARRARPRGHGGHRRGRGDIEARSGPAQPVGHVDLGAG